MISLLPSGNDISVQFLSKILGVGWQSWATGTSAAGAGRHGVVCWRGVCGDQRREHPGAQRDLPDQPGCAGRDAQIRGDRAGSG